MQVLKCDFMPPDLKKEMKKAEIDGCVAIQADQSENETEFLLALAEEHDFIKGVVGWVDLRASEVEKRLRHYSQINAFKGVRHLVQDEPDDHFLLRDDFLKGIEKLSKYGLSYDILIYPRHLSTVDKFVSKFPNQRFVLDHIAKPKIGKREIKDWEQGIRPLSQHPKLYCKLSGMITEADWENWEPEDFRPYLDVILDAFGPDRLMFGSDWPVCTLAGDYSQVIEIVKNFIESLSITEQEKIMEGNAKRFYDL